MDTITRAGLRRSASQITVAAQLFGATAMILMLVWLLHYEGGINIYSHNEDLVFNVHPFLMFFGFILFAGEGAMAYTTIAAERGVKKFCHMLLNLIAIVLGIVGIYAAFKYHNMLDLKHMTSFHSWIGMATIGLFGLQWLFGLTVFMFPKASPFTKSRALPWHICIGRALLYMAICTAETGLMQKLYDNPPESRLINFTALAILLFGIAVDISIALPRSV